MSCGPGECSFLELVAVGVGKGVGEGEGPMDVVPFVVEGGGVGVGENLNFCDDISLSLRVGDCEGDASSGSTLSSIFMSMLDKAEKGSFSLSCSSLNG
jgi:hypothetical protein